MVVGYYASGVPNEKCCIFSKIGRRIRYGGKFGRAIPAGRWQALPGEGAIRTKEFRPLTTEEN